MKKTSTTTIWAWLRTRAVLVTVLIPGATGLLALLAGPANAFIIGNHSEPLR